MGLVIPAMSNIATGKENAAVPSLRDGLIAAWYPAINAISGSTIFDVSGNNKHAAISGSGSSIGRGFYGASYNSTNSTNVAQPPNTFPTLSVFSIMAFIKTVSAGGGSYGRILATSANTNLLGCANGDVRGFFFLAGSNYNDGDLGVGTFGYNRIICRHSANVATSSIINRVIVNHGVTATTLAASQFYIGNRNDGIRALDGDIFCIAIWNRYLTDNECVALNSDPFLPIRRRDLGIVGKAPAAATGKCSWWAWNQYAGEGLSCV